MDYIDRLKFTNPQDIFAREYVYLARSFRAYGDEGERALRDGIRLYGVMRGEALRKAHLEAGLKLNLYNLFSYGDLPTDPRFRRNKIRLNPQERLSETLLCPVFNVWRDMGELPLGRIYCEEFHHAKFQSYAHKAQVNLSQTLTQEGDDYCRFSVYLRPGNMDDEEKKLSFNEYGEPEPSPVKYTPPLYQDGFLMLTLRLFHALRVTMRKWFGEEGIRDFRKATEEFADEVSSFLRSKAELVGLEYKEDYVRQNCPIPFPDDPKWSEWGELLNSETGDVLKSCFLPRLLDDLT